MQNMKQNRKRSLTGRLLIVCAFMILCLSLTACGKKEEKKTAPEKLSDFAGGAYSVGVVEGYIFGDALERNLPGAKLCYYESRDEAYHALQNGEVDAVADDEAIIRAMLRSTDALLILDGYVEPSDYAFIFPKTEEGKTLSEEFSAYVDMLRENGELAKLDEKWFGTATDNKTSRDNSELQGERTLLLAFEDDNIPFSYVSADRPVGYEIDLAIGFCEAYGYKLRIRKTDFEDELSGVADGTYDLGCSAIMVTEERKKDYYFSTPDYTGGISLCVMNPQVLAQEKQEKTGLTTSFYRSFIENEQYKHYLKGLCITLVLLISTVVFGTAFGLILYMTGKRGPLLLRGLVKLLIWLLHGVPAVMMIMLIYYSYYSKLRLGRYVAAIIGLTLAFACAVYRIFERYAAKVRDGNLVHDYFVEAIDTRAFFGELKKEQGEDILMDYREAVILCLKATTVCGYVACYDMTKVFDNLRMQYFETMVPLTLMVLVYFLLVQLIKIIFRNRRK